MINFGTNWPWNFRFIGWQGLLSFSPKPLWYCFVKRISDMNWIDYKSSYRNVSKFKLEIFKSLSWNKLSHFPPCDFFFVKKVLRPSDKMNDHIVPRSICTGSLWKLSKCLIYDIQPSHRHYTASTHRQAALMQDHSILLSH